MDILFLSPGWPMDIPLFVRGLAAAGARVHGVGDHPGRNLPSMARSALTSYTRVQGFGDLDRTLAEIIRSSNVRYDRVEALWEPLVELAARLRAHYGCPGMTMDQTLGFRDKSVMRSRVGAAGLNTPKGWLCRSVAEVADAAQSIGYPLIIKPVAGAGSANTYRIDDDAGIRRVLPSLAHADQVLLESFVQGPEHTYESICVDGQPVLESVCSYLPNTLVARQEEWISPIIFCHRRLDGALAAGATLGRSVLKTLGMGSGMTHMEWFQTPQGAAFGEVACRPPGANMVTLMNHTLGMDVGKVYGEALVHGRLTSTLPERTHAGAIVFKRAQGNGRISAIKGLDAFVAKYKDCLMEVNLRQVGQPRRDWRKTFLSDGWLVIRHEDPELVMKVAKAAAGTVQLVAS